MHERGRQQVQGCEKARTRFKLPANCPVQPLMRTGQRRSSLLCLSVLHWPPGLPKQHQLCAFSAKQAQSSLTVTHDLTCCMRKYQRRRRYYSISSTPVSGSLRASTRPLLIHHCTAGKDQEVCALSAVFEQVGAVPGHRHTVSSRRMAHRMVAELLLVHLNACFTDYVLHARY